MSDLLLFLCSIPLAFILSEIVGFLGWALRLLLQIKFEEEGKLDRLADTQSLRMSIRQLLEFSKFVSCCPRCGEMRKGVCQSSLLNFLINLNICPECGKESTDPLLMPQLITLLLVPIVVVRGGIEISTLVSLIEVCGWIVIAFMSLRYQLIVDALIYPLLWLALLSSACGHWIPLDSAVIGTAIGYLLPWVLHQIAHRLTGKEFVGNGVYKGGAAIGALLGWPIGLLALILAIACRCGVNQWKRGSLFTQYGLLPLGHYLAGVTISLLIISMRI